MGESITLHQLLLGGGAGQSAEVLAILLAAAPNSKSLADVNCTLRQIAYTLAVASEPNAMTSACTLSTQHAQLQCLPVTQGRVQGAA